MAQPVSEHDGLSPAASYLRAEAGERLQNDLRRGVGPRSLREWALNRALGCPHTRGIYYTSVLRDPHDRNGR